MKDVVLGITAIITFAAMWYIYDKMNKAKPMVIYERRKARYVLRLPPPRRCLTSGTGKPR